MDPELLALERWLKTLRPKCVTLDTPAVPMKGNDFRSRLRLVGILTAIMATAVSLMLVVGFHCLWSSNDHNDNHRDNTTVNIVAGPPKCQPAMPLTMSSASKPERFAGFELPTIHRQLAMLLDKMTIRETVPEKKPDYPVIEITVSTEPQKPSPFREHPKILRAGSTGILPETG